MTIINPAQAPTLAGCTSTCTDQNQPKSLLVLSLERVKMRKTRECKSPTAQADPSDCHTLVFLAPLKKVLWKL